MFRATAFTATFLVQSFLRHHKPLLVSDCALAATSPTNNGSECAYCTAWYGLGLLKQEAAPQSLCECIHSSTSVQRQAECPTLFPCKTCLLVFLRGNTSRFIEGILLYPITAGYLVKNEVVCSLGSKGRRAHCLQVFFTAFFAQDRAVE